MNNAFKALCFSPMKKTEFKACWGLLNQCNPPYKALGPSFFDFFKLYIYPIPEILVYPSIIVIILKETAVLWGALSEKMNKIDEKLYELLGFKSVTPVVADPKDTKLSILDKK